MVFFFSNFRLVVTAPLNVEVSPSLLSVHLGGNAEFECVVGGTSSQTGQHVITWYKDGRQLPGAGRQSETLTLNGIGREDRGMYQCIVRRGDDTAQASAELQLGGKLYNSVVNYKIIDDIFISTGIFIFTKKCHF